MQSWGLRARWGERDSSDEPTKSGIVGLIGCALGYCRDDPRIVTEIESQIRIGVRVESPGTPLKDYHTITNGVTGKDNASTILTNRTYLQDASFLVAIAGPEGLLKKVYEALTDPVWPIFLGRKSCPPTRPVVEEISYQYNSIDDSLEKYPWKATTIEMRGKNVPAQLRCVSEDPEGDSILGDRRIISPIRMYGTRKVKQYYVDTPHKEDKPCTSQD